MLSSVKQMEDQRPEANHGIFKTLSPLLVAAVAESQEKSNDYLPSVQALLDYFAQSSQDQLCFISKEPQFEHYLHRLVYNEKEHGRDNYTDKLRDFFPVEVAKCQGMDIPILHRVNKSILASKSEKPHHRRSVTEGDANVLFKYKPSEIPSGFRGADMKLSDLQSAVWSVDREIRNEAFYGFDFTRPIKRVKKIRRASESSEKPLLHPVYETTMKESDQTLFPIKKPARKCFKVSPVYINGHPIQTAQDVIEAFASRKLKAESEFVYLNYTNSDKRMPYNLTVVPKNKVDPEHFVISKFGIVCVIPNEASDMLTFSEWLREASLFMILRQIPLFRDYKLKKALHQWHKATRLIMLWHLRTKIGGLAIRYVPKYAETLLKINHLSNELLTVPFHELKPNGEYTLEEVNDSFRRTRSMTNRHLNKYFKYCKRAVCDALDYTREEVLRLETEHKHQPFVSDLPISIQQQNQKALKRNLENALRRQKKLGEFVTLAEQIVTSCLIQLAQNAMKSWNNLLSRQESTLHQASSGFQIPLNVLVTDMEKPEAEGKQPKEKESGYFLWSCFVFDDSGKLNLNPTVQDIKDLISGHCPIVLELISAAVSPLDQPAVKDKKAKSKGESLENTSLSSENLEPAAQKDKRHRSLPPSLCPSKQPVKSLKRALRGIPHADVTQLLSCGDGLLISETARLYLNLAGTEQLASMEQRQLLHHTSLKKEYFHKRLKNDQDSKKLSEEILGVSNKVFRSLDSVLKDNSWLSEVWTFLQTWKGFNNDDILEIDLVQKTLQHLHKWYNKLQSLPAHYMTPYSIVSMSTSEIVDQIIPKLLSIQKLVEKEVIDKARILCFKILKKVKGNSEILRSKRYDLEGFSEYAHTLRESTKYWSDESSSVLYVKQVHDTLYQLRVKLPQQDKNLAKELHAEWQNFQSTLVEAKDFVTKQTPIKAQGLQESINTCEEEIQEMVNEVNRGIFTDPTQLPHHVIQELVSMREKVSTIHSRLLGLCKWKDDITGFPHDLSATQILVDQLYYRQELWKYRRTFDRHETEWKSSPFKTLDIENISDKISDWLGVSKELEKSLPARDPVLSEWNERLTTLQKSIPLLLQLSSKNLKGSHWITIFAALGEDYNPQKQYTLNDFALYQIYDHSAIIFEICHDAMQQANLNNWITTMATNIEEEVLNVTVTYKDFSPLAFNKELQPPPAAKETRQATGTPTSKKAGSDKTTTFALDVIKPLEKDSDGPKIHRVSNFLETVVNLEHHLTQLKMFITSPYLGNLRKKAEGLLDTILQLIEMVGLLHDCQSKWDKLLRIYDCAAPATRSTRGLKQLQDVTTEYQLIVKSIYTDPRLLSLLDKKHGQKGFRECQGEALRNTCNIIINILNSVEAKMESLIEKACSQFPRLYFLSSKDILTVVCNQGDPHPMIPIINKLFPSVKMARFSRLSSSKSLGSSNEDYQINSVVSWFDETLTLSSPLPLGKRSGAQWLKVLNKAMSLSLSSYLNEAYSSLPDLLKGARFGDEGAVEEFANWLDSHVNQCVLVAMELHWTLSIYEALISLQPGNQLKEKGYKMSMAAKNVSEILLKRRHLWSRPTDLLMQQLILLLNRHSAAVQSLLAEQNSSVNSFCWKSQLHYSTEDSKDIYFAPSVQSGDKFRSSTSAGVKKRLSEPSTTYFTSPSKSLTSCRVNVSDSNFAEKHYSDLSATVSNKTGQCQPLRVLVRCNKATIPYGFELLQATDHVNPQTESAVFSMIQAMKNNNCSYLCSDSKPSETGKDLAIALGAHFHSVDCSMLTKQSILSGLFCSCVKSGIVLQLNNFHQLPQLLQVSLGEWFTSLCTSATATDIQSKQTVPNKFQTPDLILPYSRSDVLEPIQEWSMCSPTGSKSQRSGKVFSYSGRGGSNTRFDWYDKLASEEGFHRYANFEGSVIQVSPQFACILIGQNHAHPIPQQLKSSLRSVDIPQPDHSYLAESLLASYGFYECHTLGQSLVGFQLELKTQLLSCNPVLSSSLGISSMKTIIGHAASLLENEVTNSEDAPLQESEALVQAIILILGSQLAHPTSGEDEEDDDDLEEDQQQDFQGNTYLDIAGWNKLMNALDTHFPSEPSGPTFPEELLSAINTQLKERHLQCLPGLLEKIKQFHVSSSMSKCVFLTGPCGSGKTTCYNILNAAYEHLRKLAVLSHSPSQRVNLEKKKDQYPFVNINIINPKAYSLDELLGCYEELKTSKKEHRSTWKPGVLPIAIKKIENYYNAMLMFLHPDCSQPAPYSYMTSVTHWLVLDGPLDPVLANSLSSLVDEGLTLKNGETITLPRSCKLIIETQSLDYSTPSLLHTSIIHFSRETVSYKALVNTWLDKAPTRHNLSSTSTETLAIMINQLLPETLSYLTTTNTRHYGAEYKLWRSSQMYGFTETKCFLSFLSAVLEKNAPKEEVTGYSKSSRATSQAGSRSDSMVFSHSMVSLQTEYDIHSKDNLVEDMPIPDDNIQAIETDFTLSARLQLACMLAFAYIWSLGAFVPFNETQSFSDLARELIMSLPYNVPLPEEGLIYDYCLDLKQYTFIPWTEGKTKGVRNMGGGYFSLPELTRFSYIVDLYLSCGCNILLAGDRGTGKTSFIEKMMKKYITLTDITVTPTLSPGKLHEKIIQASIQQTKQPAYRVAVLRRSSAMRTGLCFDDIHLTSSDDIALLNTCCPTLQVIQHLVSHYIIYDSNKNWSEKHLNINYLASCTPEGYWNLPVKLTSKMCLLPFLPPSDEFLQQILSHNLQLWLATSSILTNTKQIAQALSAASVALFRSVAQRFQPTSSHPHYYIDMHDLTAAYEGLLLVSPDTKSQSNPMFSFLHRRGFLSSSQSSSQSKVSKRSGRKGLQKLPSLKSVAAKKETEQPVNSEEMIAILRTIIRAWCHESTRVYLDRSTESKDHLWFLKVLEVCIKYCFCGIEIGYNAMPKDPFLARKSMGNTAGNRHLRGSRASKGASSKAGTTRSQGTVPIEPLNEEELSSVGIKVDILKALMKSTSQQDIEVESDAEKQSPPRLISIDQVTMRGEDLTGLIFAQFPDPCTPVSTPEPDSLSSSSLESKPSSSDSNESLVLQQKSLMEKEHPLVRPYSELGDGQVSEILSKHLEHFQVASKRSDIFPQKEGTDIVLYKEAMEHCARLYRILNLPGAHALLLGLPGSGKRSLIKLVAYIMQSSLMNVDSSCTNTSLRTCLREACISASLDNCNTILVISDHCPINSTEWDLLLDLMNYGSVGGLFTSLEVTEMGNKLSTRKMKRNTTEAAAQAFRQAIQTNLHVIIMWTVDSVNGSLFTTEHGIITDDVHHLDKETHIRNLFQALQKSCSYIDYYKPWTKNVYSDIAIKWWERESSLVNWQDWVSSSSQLEAIGGLAAHVHLTTSELLTREYGSYSRMMLTPRILMECLTLTQHIAISIKRKEEMKMSKFKFALQKLLDIDQILFEHECKLAELNSTLAIAEEDVHHKMGLITTAKERYMEANKRCKEADKVIEFETTNVQKLAAVVDNSFEQVRKTYSGALESLSCINDSDIFELMSYRKPPEVLFPVFNALCMIFDRQENWDECKILLMSHKFIDSLKFFDRDKLPVVKLRKLKCAIYECIDPEALKAGSKAILPIYKWLNALVDYHLIMKKIEPLKRKLKVAEDTLGEANVVFVTMKRDMMLAKNELENSVKKHKESVKKARALELEIEAVKTKIEETNCILTTMSKQRKKWEERLEECQSCLDSIPGHAMLCAAGVHYLARTPTGLHKELLTNWLGYCSGSISLGSILQDSHKLQPAQSHGSYSGQRCVVKVQKDFSLAYHFSDQDERYLWEQESSFPDSTIMDRTLCARIFNQSISSAWPLIFDPYRQFESYLRALTIQEEVNKADGESDDVFTKSSDVFLSVDSTSSNLKEMLDRAQAEEIPIILHIDIDQKELTTGAFKDKRFLTNILHKKKNSAATKYSNTKQQGFQLYLVVHRTVREILMPGRLSMLTSTLHHLGLNSGLDGNIVDMELIKEALEYHLLKLVMSYVKPEYHIRYKSFVTDLILHKQKLEEKEEEMLSTTLDSKHQSLLSAEDLLDILKEKEKFEVTALEQIQETSKNLEQFEKQLKMYQPLTRFASAVLSSLERLSSVFQYFSFKIEEFEKILSELIMRFKTSRPANNPMSVNAHVLHLKNCLMLSVYKNFQVQVFEKHQLLIPLLIEFALENESGKVDDKEMVLLCWTLGGLAAQLECEEMGIKNASLYNKPNWVTDKSWCIALELQKNIPNLRRLMVDVSSSSAEWKEYFNLASSTMASIPGTSDRYTFTQKLLLWKCFRQDKFHLLAKDGVLALVGADLIETKSPNLKEILKLSSPNEITLLLLPKFPAQFPSLNSIREEATSLSIEINYFALDVLEKYDAIVEKLDVYASEKCWLLIEYCHLMPNYPDILDVMNEKLANLEVNSKFRVLVLIPVEHLSKHSSISRCHKLVFQTTAEPNEFELSHSLLKDMSRFVAYTRVSMKSLGAIYTSNFSSCSHVFTKFQAFLPEPLTDSDLKALDPQLQHTDDSIEAINKDQDLLLLVYEELCLHNQAILKLHALTALLLGFHRGTIPFSKTLGKVLGQVCKNKTPRQWEHYLPSPLGHVQGLISAVKLLKTRWDMYISMLKTGSMPRSLNPLMFSNLDEIFSRIATFYSMISYVEKSTVVMKATLESAKEKTLLSKNSSAASITLHGLTLHNACWDSTKQCLTEPHEETQPQDSTSSSITVFPMSKLDASTGNIQDVPVLLDPKNSKPELTLHDQRRAALFHIPFLHAFEERKQTRNIYFTCDINLS